MKNNEYELFFLYLKYKNISQRRFFGLIGNYVLSNSGVEKNIHLRNCHRNFAMIFEWAFEWRETIEGEKYWEKISREWTDIYSKYRSNLEQHKFVTPAEILSKHFHIKFLK